jgi:hypothetical protein
MDYGERESRLGQGRRTGLARFNRNKRIFLRNSNTMYFYLLKTKKGRPAFSGNSRAVQSASAGPLPAMADGATRRDQEEPQRAGERARRVRRP